MKTRPLTLILALVFLFSAGAELYAAEVDFILNNLPRAYAGTFRWRDSNSIQTVSISIKEVNATDEGNVVAFGKGQYITDQKTIDVDISIVIFPFDLVFKMFERDPVGSSDFVTEGHHLGQISSDLKSIKAVWTTDAGGRKGDLILKSTQ